MELSQFLRQLEPIVGDMQAKIKTDNWIYHGKKFRKVTIIWSSESEQCSPVELEVVNKD